MVCSNMGQQFIGRTRLDRSRVDTSFALRETDNIAFARCATSSLPLRLLPKHATSYSFYLLSLFFLQLTDMIGRYPQSLDGASYRLVVQSKIIGQAMRRLRLIKSEDNFQLPAKKLASLLSLALITLDVPSFRPTRVGQTAQIYSPPREQIAVVPYLPVTRHTLP